MDVLDQNLLIKNDAAVDGDNGDDDDMIIRIWIMVFFFFIFSVNLEHLNIFIIIITSRFWQDNWLKKKDKGKESK